MYASGDLVLDCFKYLITLGLFWYINAGISDPTIFIPGMIRNETDKQW